MSYLCLSLWLIVFPLVRSESNTKLSVSVDGGSHQPQSNRSVPKFGLTRYFSLSGLTLTLTNNALFLPHSLCVCLSPRMDITQEQVIEEIDNLSQAMLGMGRRTPLEHYSSVRTTRSSEFTASFADQNKAPASFAEQNKAPSASFAEQPLRSDEGAIRSSESLASFAEQIQEPSASFAEQRMRPVAITVCDAEQWGKRARYSIDNVEKEYHGTSIPGPSRGTCQGPKRYGGSNEEIKREVRGSGVSSSKPWRRHITRSIKASPLSRE